VSSDLQVADKRVTTRDAMVAGMDPVAMPGRFVFKTLGDDCGSAGDLTAAIGMFREPEGVSVIIPASEGADLVMAQITLNVHSALDGVGLTAAVSGALAEAGIPCNIVAAHHHDHVFVPEKDAPAALETLRDLANDRGGR